jgi:hypothetical protein
MDSTRNVLGGGNGAAERYDENWENGNAAGHQVFWSGYGGWKKNDHESGNENENDCLLESKNDDLIDHLGDNVNDLCIGSCYCYLCSDDDDEGLGHRGEDGLLESRNPCCVLRSE